MVPFFGQGIGRLFLTWPSGWGDFQGAGDENFQTGAGNLRASGVNDQFEVIILKEEITFRCLWDRFYTRDVRWFDGSCN